MVKAPTAASVAIPARAPRGARTRRGVGQAPAAVIVQVESTSLRVNVSEFLSRNSSSTLSGFRHRHDRAVLLFYSIAE